MFGLAAMDGVSRPCSLAMAMHEVPFNNHNDTVTDQSFITEPSNSGLASLPSELIDHILSYLSPLDLSAVSRVSHVLYAHALADHLWQSIVQANVPGGQVTTSYPCASFRELYVAHDPHWFLTKYKIWFCDKDLSGKLVIARYDERRGVIEGYQLLATSVVSSSEANSPSLMQTDLEIHNFDPQVHLHLDKPILQIGATTSGNKFSAETRMSLEDKHTDAMVSNLLLARALPDSTAAELSNRSFPYGNVWPPPAIPAATRVSASHLVEDGAASAVPHDLPVRRSEISDKVFKIRSWLDTSPASFANISLNRGDSLNGGWSFNSAASLFGQVSRPWLPSLFGGSDMPMSVRLGDSVTTYSTLEPDLYTPTADQPWKGIWVGDYSSHGCEFLLIKQNHATPFDEEAFDATRTDCETEAEFARRKTDARKYRGSLEAVKLTGDVNVPRGECTFVADDLGENGFVTTVQEQPFLGARVVQSKGHIARSGFTHDRYIPSQLLLISEDRLAQLWVGYNHISFFQRVNIDQFLVPS
ncbi:hypothetical protein BD289DRAFT_227200 [Coniella lustricola]|uniref:F-box domain-containing protein n=1 Tax=Coniella lustricola TaxID=2025994 RepID=A0A2T3AAL6_9PEZI|nr:hypothetical protein BD289DRAFT_227200 [Coniella lustricola]